MTRGRILRELVVRNTLWATWVGALLAGIFGLLIVLADMVTNQLNGSTTGSWWGPLFYVAYAGGIAALIGGLLGAILGAVGGIIGGVLIGVFTMLAFFPPPTSNATAYRMAITGINMATGVVTTLVLVPIAMLLLSFVTEWTDPGVVVVWLIIPALIAAVAAWRVSRSVARWYEREAMAREASASHDGQADARSAVEEQSP